jgi:hypothetical protein
MSNETSGFLEGAMSDAIYNYIDATIVVNDDQELQQLYEDIGAFVDSMDIEEQVDFCHKWG